MGDSSGNVVLFVQYTCLEFAGLLNKFRIGKNVLDEIAGRISSSPDANGISSLTRNQASIFQCCPGKFQQDSLLRASHLRSARRCLEESRIKMVRVFNDAPGSNVVGSIRFARIKSRIQFFFCKELYRLATIDKVVPEFRQVPCTRHTCRHAYDGVLSAAVL